MECPSSLYMKNGMSFILHVIHVKLIDNVLDSQILVWSIIRIRCEQSTLSRFEITYSVEAYYRLSEPSYSIYFTVYN